jgi:O-antigen ligase
MKLASWRLAQLWGAALGAVALATAVAAGREIAHGRGAWVTLALACGAFITWVVVRPEHAALGVVVVLPFLFYGAGAGGKSLFAGVPLVAAVSVALLLAQRDSMDRLRWRLSVRAFAVLFVAAAVASAHASNPTTAGSRLLYLGLFGLFAWSLAASVAAGRMSARALAGAIVLSASIASIALIVQVLLQFAVGQHAVTAWLQTVFRLFAGSRAAEIAQQQQNWMISSLGVVRGIFPFMAAPSAGQYTMMGLIAAVWLWRQGRGERSPVASLMLFGAVVLIGAGLLATYSRQSWVGALAGLGALALRRNPLKPVALILVLFVVLSATPIPGGHSTFGDYLLTASSTGSVSSGTRLGLWSQAIHLVPHHWLVGVGPGLYDTLNPDPFKPVYYAHNVWLDELVELGVVGTMALVAVFVLTMRSAFRRGATLGFALLASFVVANLFDDVLYFPRNGILMAAAFALAATSASSRQAPIRSETRSAVL